VTPSRMLFLPLLIGAALLSPAFAQESQLAPQKLTLSDAIARAERQNLDLAAARAQRAVAEAGVRAAGQRPNPTLSAGASRDTPHENVLIDQPLEIGPKRGRRIDVARQEIAVTEADVAALQKQVRHNVRDAYFALAHARAATAQQGDIVKLADRLLDIAKSRFNAGDIPKLEVTQSELESARAHANRQVAEQEERVALSELDALLNEPAITDWDLGDPFLALPQLPTLDDLVARARGSNSEIAKIDQQVKLEQRREALLKAERIPNLGVQFGADLNNPGPPGAVNTGGYEVAARGQLSMELPIFSRNQGEIAQSVAKTHALEDALAAARRAVDAKVESAYLELQARQTQAQLYRETILPSSRQLEEMSEESYRAGKASILTVLGVQRDVQQGERDYLDSLLAVQSAFSQLEEAVGAPLD
jgi:cobalt-zinc-cadmium efflux system outer membrane protein